MNLPLPTVSNIDVTAERIRDVERDAARPLPDFAGAATKAVQVGSAMVELGEQDKHRQEADWFQKEYVDKGWEGAQQLWQETGADPKLNPAYYRTAFGDTPTKYFELLGKKIEEQNTKDIEAKGREAAGAYADQSDPLLGDAVRKGGVKGDVAVQQIGQNARTKTSTDSREKISEDRANVARDIANIRAAKKGATAEDADALEIFENEITSLSEQIKAIRDSDSTGYSLSDRKKGELSDLVRRRNDSQRNANILIRNGAKAGKGGGETVWRKAADGKEYEYNASTKQPTGRSR